MQEERSQEISSLKLQIAAQVIKMKEYKQQVSTLENTRMDHKSSHAAKLITINEKYNNTRLKLISQLKLLGECEFLIFFKRFLNIQYIYMLHLDIFIFLPKIFILKM